MQLLASLGLADKPNIPVLFFLTQSEEEVFFLTPHHWEDAVAKSDNFILESSDKDVHPSKESNKGSETEPSNISEVNENSASQVSQFNRDQCIC